jgi:hypothetical protein
MAIQKTRNKILIASRVLGILVSLDPLRDAVLRITFLQGFTFLAFLSDPI